MDALFILVPIALILGLIGLGLMVWGLRSGQFEDLEGPAHRILYEDDQELIPPEARPDNEKEASPPKDS